MWGMLRDRAGQELFYQKIMRGDTVKITTFSAFSPLWTSLHHLPFTFLIQFLSIEKPGKTCLCQSFLLEIDFDHVTPWGHPNMQMATKKVSWFLTLGELKKCFSVVLHYRLQIILRITRISHLLVNDVKRLAFFCKGHWATFLVNHVISRNSNQ